MHLFTNNRNILSNLKEQPFKLEKEIQDLFEQNLESITGYRFIKSEFSIKSNRIDTLAFDEESKAFVIIEYKRNQNYSVIDQGVSYLNLMLEYKADFIVEYNETQKSTLKRNDVDWSQSKIIFISPSFNDFQKQSSNFKDLAIELWEIKKFENDIVIVNPLKKSKSAPSIKQVHQNGNSEISKVTKEIKVYTEDDHLQTKNDMVKELYETFRDAILLLSSDIHAQPKKWYISFSTDKIVLDIVILKDSLKLYISNRNGKFEDLVGISTEVNDKTKWGKGYYLINVNDTKYLEYIMILIKQVL